MPWTSILSFIITFLYQKSRGKSTAAAALTGAAVGLGTYYLADPANPNNLFKIGVDPKSTSTGSGTVNTAGTTAASGSSGVADVIGKTVTTTGAVLQSWGSTGTAAVIGTTALAKSPSFEKYLPWILGGVALLILRK